ncbi:MAG: hypothetical protein JWQ43_1993, partial [Glaciihabitans sp.]|nr:hypothetical protein [Glaciihabitans sp.]
GAWFGDNPILGATIAVVAALGIGLVIDRASNWVSTRSVGRGRAASTDIPRVDIPRIDIPTTLYRATPLEEMTR